MIQEIVYSIGGLLLFCIGLYGLVACEHLFRKILAFNIMSSGVFLFLVSVALSGPDHAPDPVPQAMVLTGIVVTVSATAFALVLLSRISSVTGARTLSENERDTSGEG